MPARLIRVIVTPHLQIGQLFAVEFGFGDEYAARNHLSVPHERSVRRFAAHESHQRLDIAGCGNDEHPVAAVQLRIRAGQLGFAARAADARNHELAQREFAELRDAHALDRGIAHLDRDAAGRQILQRIGAAAGFALLPLRVDAQQIAQCRERQDRPHHAQRIGHGITRSYVGRFGSGVQVAEGLLRGAQPRGVGYGSGHHADEGRHRKPRQTIERNRRPDAEQHGQYSDFVERNAALAERGKESGTDLQTDRIDEQDQSELLEKMQQMAVDVHPVPSESDPHEQDARYAERHAGNPDFAEHDPQRHDQRENQHRVGYASAPQGGRAHEKPFEQLHTEIRYAFPHSSAVRAERRRTTCAPLPAPPVPERIIRYIRLNSTETVCPSHGVSRHRIDLAGLLTYSRSEAFPIPRGSVAEMFGTNAELHSSGTVRDLHPIPFSFRRFVNGRKTKSGANIGIESEKRFEKTKFFSKNPVSSRRID